MCCKVMKQAEVADKARDQEMSCIMNVMVKASLPRVIMKLVFENYDGYMPFDDGHVLGGKI